MIIKKQVTLLSILLLFPMSGYSASLNQVLSLYAKKHSIDQIADCQDMGMLLTSDGIKLGDVEFSKQGRGLWTIFFTIGSLKLGSEEAMRSYNEARGSSFLHSYEQLSKKQKKSIEDKCISDANQMARQSE